MTARRIAYFVHDLTDPAVHRRVKMLTAGGASVTVLGFRRTQELRQSFMPGTRVIDLGRTVDGRLARRAFSVASTLARMTTVAPVVRESDAILARNLEMLILGSRARRLYAPDAKLVYESLDIHRLLLSRHPIGGILRAIESGLWRGVDVLLTSSPAFVRHYFSPRHFRRRIHIEENKVAVFDNTISEPRQNRRQAGPPWRVGQFGMIRCRKSLQILNELAAAMKGEVEIIVRGRPSDLVFPDFGAELKRLPHIRYLGPYRNPDDLADIYGQVHFNWTIDYYESGLNSSWLLPCRMYEGSLFGSVPIAEKGVETANWLVQRNAGVILGQPLEQNLFEFFKLLDEAKYSALMNRVAAIQRQDLVSDRAECERLVCALTNPSQQAASLCA